MGSGAQMTVQLEAVARRGDTLKVQFMLGAAAWGMGSAHLQLASRAGERDGDRLAQWRLTERWFGKALPYFERVTANVTLPPSDVSSRRRPRATPAPWPRFEKLQGSSSAGACGGPVLERCRERVSLCGVGEQEGDPSRADGRRRRRASGGVSRAPAGRSIVVECVGGSTSWVVRLLAESTLGCDRVGAEILARLSRLEPEMFRARPARRHSAHHTVRCDRAAW